MSISPALLVVSALGLLVSSAGTSAAQSAAQSARPQQNAWEFRVSSGAFVPAGDQRQQLEDAHATAAQLSWLVRPSLAITGTFGWARSRDVALSNAPRLDVFTSDVGVESRLARRTVGRSVSFRPFIGVGAGARSYNYRSLSVDASHNLAAYASVGGALGMGRVGVRLEVRDYATGFRPLASRGASAVRNDVVLMAALSFNRRAAHNQ